MTENEKYLIGLISSHLNSYDSPPHFDETNWQDLFNLSLYHHVTSMVTAEINRLDNIYQPDSINDFKTYCFEITDSNRQFITDLSSVIELLSTNSIHHLILNGLTINLNYPMPESMDYSDTIIVVSEQDFQSTINLLLECGYEKTNDKPKSVVLMNGNTTLTIAYEICSVNVQSKIYYSDFLGDITDCQGYTHKLKPHYELLFSLINLLYHLKMGDSTIKMLTDIDVILRHQTDVDINEFYNFCDKVKIKQSADVILNLCKKWFNSSISTSFDFESDKQLYDILTSSILRSSAFGVTRESPLSSIKRLSNKKPLLSENRGLFSKIKSAKSSVFSDLNVSKRLKEMLNELYVES